VAGKISKEMKHRKKRRAPRNHHIDSLPGVMKSIKSSHKGSSETRKTQTKKTRVENFVARHGP